MSEPRGAGTAGGLLFIAVLLFVAYLAVTAVAGVLKFVIGTAFVVVIIALGLSILKRR
jgi:hypothetical protein